MLLVKRGKAPFLDYWSLPGGRIEAGESAEQAACRELNEETGLVANGLRFVMEHRPAPAPGEPRSPVRYALSVFAGDKFQGIPHAADDAVEVGWFAVEQLDRLTITPRTPEIVQRAQLLLDTHI